MPKATLEGGASNAWICAQCGAQVTPGAPRCPECPSTEFIEPEVPAGLGDEDPVGSHAGDEPEEVPADGAEPDAAAPEDAAASDEPSAPAVPPRMPPRRTA